MIARYAGTAVVTGASSGIGALYAERLAHRGHDLVLVARDRRRLAGLADRLIGVTGQQIGILAVDLTEAGDLARVERRLREDTTITMLVNNAGFGAVGPLVQSDLDRMEAMIRLNITALTRLAGAVAPGMAARGHGRIVNIASTAALTPALLNGVYGASKAYVLAFTEALRIELMPSGVQVQAVLPGATRTPFWEEAGIDPAMVPPEYVMQAEDMVDAALAGLDQGEAVTIPSLPDMADWDRFEAARQALIPGLSRDTPAERYRTR